MADKVNIEIGGDTSGAEASIKDLEQVTKKSFSKMSNAAEETSQDVSKAFKSAGIRTEKAINESSRKARRDFEKIKKSGVASANDIKRAHNAMTLKIKRNNAELKTSNKGIVDSFNNMKAKIATIGVVIASAFGVKAVGEAIKFEDALLDLQKVLSDADGDAQQFADAAEEMAVKFGVSTADVLQSAADFKQAGFDISEAFSLTESALKLVVASELEAAEASQLLVLTLNGFKAPASEANRLINILNATSNKYATNVRELGTGMRDIAPIAEKMGFSFEETAGLLTPVISVFGSGSEAAQALKSGLLRLVGSQKPVIEELDRLGISQTDLNGKLRSGKDILLDVSKAFQGMSNNQKIASTSILSGILQAGKMSEVFNGMGLSIEVTNNALQDTDSINKEVATRMTATGVQIDRVKTAFNNMAQTIGTEALPMIKRAIDVLIPLLQTLGGFGVQAILRLQKAWLQTSLTINESIIGIAKVTDFVGLTSSATDTIAADSEKLADRIAAVDKRLFETSAEGIAQSKEVEAAKAREVEAAAKQNEASEMRKQKIAEENAAMLQQVEVLTQLHAAKQKAAETFVGPPAPTHYNESPADALKRASVSSSTRIKRFKVGGGLSGYGGGDKIPALLEAGEHIIRKESVKKLGRGAVEAVNRGDVGSLLKQLNVQKFQEGGEVRAQKGGSDVNVNLSLEGKTFPMTASSSVADGFSQEIKSINVVRGRKRNPY
ncbi:MAG: phage tail tape measure protein [Candidatus Scalindua sp.]|nr:phage tail tape measure protein [Candidatus Scalindua sp.]